MMNYLSVLILGIFAHGADSPVDHKALFRLWEKPVRPAAGRAESIGSFSAGCLNGGVKLPADGTGFSVMRPSRVRYYGHPKLVEYLRELGQSVEKAGLKRMLVGDMGRPRGGPMISGHASHQSGLDVDIWYQFTKQPPTKRDRERLGATSFVSREGKVTRAWTHKQRRLVELAAESPEVDRIFVHAAIKRDLCRTYSEAPWLRKLRPWWGHDDHLHVRLRCAEGDALCVGQEQPPATAEHCGQEIDWWFSEEAKEELAKRKASHGREFPALPEACDALVAEYRK